MLMECPAQARRVQLASTKRLLVLASHAPSPPAAAAAAWRGRGRVPIAGWCEEWVRRG